MKNFRFQISDFRFQILIAPAIALTALGLGMLTAVSAQGPNLDDEVNRISKGLYCPVCPGTPLDVCQTQACVQWRAQIKEKLREGETEQQISDYFVAQYGSQVLGAPPAQGFNWLAYLLPALAIFFGASIAWFTVSKWLGMRKDKAMAIETREVPREYAERIEQELKEY